MSNSEKIMHFANFNITFGTNEEPMLLHFDDIIFPAFLSDHKRGKENEYPQFYFSDVKVKKIDDEYVLVGNYIKDTKYEVYTTMKDGELVSTPSSVPTAPYSRFIVFLRNHRMVLVRNESQSPDVRSFQATTREVIFTYIRNYNHNTVKKEDRLPHSHINIVDIPLPSDIEAVLKDVKKINYLKMRFFPLNNDINPVPMSQDIDEQMKRMKCKNANVQFTSPESKDEVKGLIERSAGLAVSTLLITDENGNKTKIKEEQFSSSTRIPFGRDISSDDDEYLAKQAKKNEAVSTVSKDNNSLYERLKVSIAKLIN